MATFIRVAVAAAAVLLAGSRVEADTLGTNASVRSNNSLLVDIQVTTGSSAEHVVVTYQTAGVDPLVSRVTQVSTTGSTTITIGRLRANRTYTYTVDAFDRHGGLAGTTGGSFTTGSLPAPLLKNIYTLTGRTTAPLVILPHAEVIAGVGTFQGYVALDLHSSDARRSSGTTATPRATHPAFCKAIQWRRSFGSETEASSFQTGGPAPRRSPRMRSTARSHPTGPFWPRARPTVA